MHVLFITEDKRFLQKISPQRELLNLLSEATESLHVVVLTTWGQGFVKEKIGEKTWIYPTNSASKLLYYIDGLTMIRQQVRWKDELFADLILSDDPKISGWIGMRTAAKYGRAWMLNLHEFYWGQETRPLRLFSHYTVIPLVDVFQNAQRIIAFSKRVAIYTQAVVKSDEEKAKVVVFPEIYSAQTMVESIDVKVRYPEFNFTVLMYMPEGATQLPTALSMMTILRASYQKAGLIIMTAQKPTAFMNAQVRLKNATPWVRFEVIPYESFPVSRANVFLYLNGGEQEDSMLIRAITIASTPVIAVQSIVSERVLHDNVSGLIIYDHEPKTLVAAIRKLNETPGLRELFRVNAGLPQQSMIPTKAELLSLLTEYFSFPYEERPTDAPGPDTHLFANLTQSQSVFERMRTTIKKLKDRYTKL